MRRLRTKQVNTAVSPAAAAIPPSIIAEEPEEESFPFFTLMISEQVAKLEEFVESCMWRVIPKLYPQISENHDESPPQIWKLVSKLYKPALGHLYPASFPAGGVRIVLFDPHMLTFQTSTV